MLMAGILLSWNLTKDSNKNISTITYNVLNLPQQITFSDGSTITYSYAADGTKLRTVHVINSATTTKDYCGNVVYENGVQKLLLTEEGYVDLSNTSYYYYLKDHQGNNRVVINSSGAVQETNHYYPFGGVFASSNNVQPYKYNGKELDTKKGLNWYDYGARHYDAMLGRWFVVDPMAEKYYAWNPYNYCKNTPLNRIDIGGTTDYKLTDLGQIKRFGDINDAPDRLFYGHKYVMVNDKSLLKGLSQNMGGDYNRRRFYQETSNLRDAAVVFKFAADNSDKEWKLDVYKDSYGNMKAVVATNMDFSHVSLTDAYDDEHAKVKSMSKIVDIHSHPDKDGTRGGEVTLTLKMRTKTPVMPFIIK